MKKTTPPTTDNPLIVAPQLHVTLDITIANAQGETLSEPGDTLAIVIGQGEFFEPCEAALMGLRVGETAYAELEPHQHSGDYNPDLLRVEPAAKFPDNLEEGMQFEGIPGEAAVAGQDAVIYTVTDITDEVVVLDGNHPLAGETLRFKMTVRDIAPATPSPVALAPAGTLH